MAAAACSHGSHRFPGLRHSAVRGDQQQHQPPPQQQQQTPQQQQQQQQSVRKRSDSRRRQAALHFLSNISLDGRLPLDVTNGFAELEPLDEATAPARLGSLSCISAIQSGALVTQMPRFGPGAGATYGGGGPVFTFPRDTSLCGQTQAPGAAEGNSEAPVAGTPAAAAAAAGSGTPLLKSAAQGLLSPAQAASPFGLDLQKQRSRTSSGSPHPKNTKKVHFIKNMRQYDTRNSRIVLICAKRSLCSAFSVLPYGEFINNSDNKLDGQRQRNPSGGGGSSTDMILGLEGVELGVDGKDCMRPRISNEEGLKVEPLKSVSYAQFLYPTNAFVTQRSVLEASGPCQPARTSVHRNVASGRISNATVAMELGSESGDLIEYDPNLLDDPQWPCGKHKRVLIFASYMTTVIEYVKPSDLKKDMNETFKEKFPHIKLTLSKIRSLKREMRNLAEECNLEPCTVALSFVYFEKLVLQGKVNKQNRKLCSGACLLLAAKISSDLKKYEVKHLIDKLEERLRLNSKELVSFEFAALVALEFGLYLPGKKVFPHYRRLVQQS